MSAVFLKILNMSITASWLILAVVLARLLLKKAPKWIPCILWGLVAIRLIFPFSIRSIFSLIPSSETIPADITVQQEPAINSGIAAVNEFINPVIAETFTPAPTDSANPLQIIIPVAAIIWISGFVIMLAYALFSFIRLKRTVSVCVPVGERIISCDEVKTPFILGVFRPVIYVPSSMSRETLDLVIRHETAHLQRHDHWWKPLGYLLLAIYWFNPLCWIAYILLCRDIEMACDEKVIRDMDKDDLAAYSQALLDCSFPRKRIAACPLAFGEVGVKERVKGVLNYKKPAFWIILIAVIACIVLAVCLMTDPFSTKEKSVVDKIEESPVAKSDIDEQYFGGTPAERVDNLFASGDIKLTLYLANAGTCNTYSVSDWYSGRFKELLGCYNWTELEMPSTEPSEFWLTAVSGDGKSSMTFWSNRGAGMVQFSDGITSTFWSAVPANNYSESIAKDIRLEYDNLDVSITIDVRTDVCELYLKVLEDLWNVDSGLNDGISQIGIDLSELSHLTDLEKETVMNEFASNHNLPCTMWACGRFAVLYIISRWQQFFL